MSSSFQGCAKDDFGFVSLIFTLQHSKKLFKVSKIKIHYISRFDCIQIRTIVVLDLTMNTYIRTQTKKNQGCEKKS